MLKPRLRLVLCQEPEQPRRDAPRGQDDHRLVLDDEHVFLLADLERLLQKMNEEDS